MKILLVDDHPVVIDGMRKMLQQHFPADVINTANSVGECLASLRSLKPDLVILDIRLPDGSGIDLCQQIKSLEPLTKAILFSGSPGQISKKMLEKSQADGWLSKNAPTEVILNAINEVSQGGHFFSDEEFFPGDTSHEIYISPRELEVLKLIADGLVNKEIADKLFISVTTVDSHRKNLLLKFNVSNTAALISEAYRKGFLELNK